MEKVIVKAKNLHLSILGGNNVVQRYALPILHYSTSIDTPSPAETKRVQNLINWFLFSREQQYLRNTNYQGRMNRTRMAAPVEEGGLGLAPLETYNAAQKAHWIVRALQNKVSEGWVHALKEMFDEIRAREPNSLRPVECLNAIPAYIKQDRRSTLVQMLTEWYKLKCKIDCTHSKYVGSSTLRGTARNVFKAISSNKESTLVRLLDWNGRNGRLSPPDPISFRLNNVDLTPVKVTKIDGWYFLTGNANKKIMLRSCSLPNGKKLKEAEFSDVLKSKVPKEAVVTDKQTAWKALFPDFSNNFKRLAGTPIRMRVKSNIFLRYANCLPRTREVNCCLCQRARESSNHVLYQCQILRTSGRTIVEALERHLGIHLVLDEFLMAAVHFSGPREAVGIS
jgi:hypothetical protein